MERRTAGVSLLLRRAARGGFDTYGTAVALVGAALVATLVATGESVPFGDWRYWLMALLVLAGELIPIDVPRRDGVDRVAISTAFAFAVLLQFGLLPAVAAYAAASVLADALARLSPLKIAFNAAQYSLSLAAAALMLSLAGHPAPIGDLGDALPAVF